MSESGIRVDEWRERLGRYATANWTIAEFCDIEGVSVSSFYQWRKRLGHSPSRAAPLPARRADFAAVRLVGSANAIVQLPGGTRLEIPMSDSDAFERALDALMRADGQRAEAARC